MDGIRERERERGSIGDLQGRGRGELVAKLLQLINEQTN